MKVRKPRNIERIEQAVLLLQQARDLLKEQDCPKTLDRVRLALSSAKGAVRNAGYHVGPRQWGQVG